MNEWANEPISDGYAFPFISRRVESGIIGSWKPWFQILCFSSSCSVELKPCLHLLYYPPCLSCCCRHCCHHRCCLPDWGNSLRSQQCCHRSRRRSSQMCFYLWTPSASLRVIQSMAPFCSQACPGEQVLQVRRHASLVVAGRAPQSFQKVSLEAV